MTKIVVPNDLLRKAREEHHWTQQQLAEMLGIGLSTIRSWEAGRRSPSLALRARLCELFQMLPAELGLEQANDDVLQTPPPDALVTGSSATFDELSLPAGLLSQARQLLLMKQESNQNRRRFLARVHSIWIDDVLAPSLHYTVPLALNLVELPQALTNPWHHAVQETTGAARPLPPGISIVQVYDDAQGDLLILGEPGAGKTTLLLELARVLLVRAGQDESLPIPVVFNLSSWTVKHLDLADWLMEELQSKYQLPKKLAQEWVEADRLALLLDGLDEVAEEALPACMKAISSYRQERAFVPLLICCRKEEYFAQPSRMLLQQAVLIQPLSREQIDEYLSHAAQELEAVQRALQEDPELEEMIRTPLMLSIVTLAYQGDDASLVLIGTKEERRRQMLRTYVQRMLARRSVTRYSPHETIRRLSWLAKQMEIHNQSVFYLERMQPDWQSSGHSYRQYRLMVNRLFVSVTVLIYSGLLACFRGDFLPKQPGLFFWLGGGNGDSVLGWMSPGMGGGLPGSASLSLLFALVTILVHLLGRKREKFAFSARVLKRALLTGLFWGVLIGGGIGVVAVLIFSRGGAFVCAGGLSSVACGSSIGLFGGGIAGLQIAMVAFLKYNAHHLPEGKKSSKAVFLPKDRLLNAIIFGICGFLGLLLVYSWQARGINQLGIGYSLIAGAYFGLIYNQGFEKGLLPELGVTIQFAETAVWSWKEVRANFGANLKKGASLAAVALIYAVLFCIGVSSLFYGIRYGLLYGLVYGSVAAAISGVTGFLMGVLTSGWSSDLLDERQFARPNEGTHRSFKNAVFAASVFGPLGGLASGFVSALAFALSGISGWFTIGAGLALIFSLACSYQIFMNYGGEALFEHYVLRWSLWRRGILPWDSITFLNYAVERILMRKVGGGYMFIHRLLLEYFANDADGEQSIDGAGKESHVQDR